jgi:large subunit ribosomal protein L18
MSSSNQAFIRRKQRVRTKLRKVSDRNRLSVFKSGRHVYAQIRKPLKSNCNIEFAIKVGKLLADRAEKKSIKLVAFDKGGHKYHGVVKALADEARKKLQF